MTEWLIKSMMGSAAIIDRDIVRCGSFWLLSFLRCVNVSLYVVMTNTPKSNDIICSKVNNDFVVLT